ncbi:DMT family transporter [Paenibacillus aceris]|uniref:Paired small multidrug resistance pump n=1 Tax=Paenibacillus aceris TaxID=869555 RepID=A0ABS4I0Q1_9BACL|nr:multidrug efflux SMR transporter [Paenibacillus aceris]MBP1964295.1 paired small multidrug resistance pump [Paenibacillus aceris]NHW36615.1 multidrug efflux SMR transporter [Paenibacillus aceris]
MKWLTVFIAGILEVIWASNLKHASTALEWIVTFVLIAVSFGLLIYSYRKIPVAAAYTVFVGIGAVGTYLVGIMLGEPLSAMQILFLMLLIVGVIGMKAFTKDDKKETSGDS